MSIHVTIARWRDVNDDDRFEVQAPDDTILVTFLSRGAAVSFAQERGLVIKGNEI